MALGCRRPEVNQLCRGCGARGRIWQTHRDRTARPGIMSSRRGNQRRLRLIFVLIGASNGRTEMPKRGCRFDPDPLCLLRNFAQNGFILRILSVRQPWASLIVSGVKDIENRTWPTEYRGPVLIHSSLATDRFSDNDIARQFGASASIDQPRGGIIGITEIIDCVRAHKSPWLAPGHRAFVLARSRTLPFVPWKGALALREAPQTLLDLIGSERVTA